MVEKVKFTGLDCPNCAKALENKLNNLKSVQSAKIEFFESQLVYECEKPSKAFKDIKTLTKQMFPDVVLLKEDNKETKKAFYSDLLFFVLGVFLSSLVLFVKMPAVLFWIIFILSALLIGYKTYIKAFKLVIKGVINENLLVTLSIIGATAVGEYLEGLMVIVLYTIGKFLESLAVNKSRKSIKELTNLKPEYSVVFRDGKEEKVSPKDVKINEVILVKPGERVALDGIVIEGKANINTQSLTGESLPTLVDKNSEILSGSIVLDGVLKIRVTSIYENSTVSKILNLIENASEKKSKTETVISKIAKWYTIAVMIASVIVTGIVWLVLRNWNDAIYRGLIFLLISCPCAFAISVPLTYFSGLGNASRHGILIKGSNYLDACAKLGIVAFDKTGTLTTGEFEIEEIKIFNKNYSKEDLIFVASLGEQYSMHPLAKAILQRNTKKLESVKFVKEVAGEGVYFTFENTKYFVGRKKSNSKATIVEVYKKEEKLGEIYFKDTIKTSANLTCKQLNNMHIKTVLLSGDNKEIVDNVAKQVGTDESFSNMLPQDKYSYIENLKKNKDLFVGYVGDGINDAPSLMLSDIGISMGLNGSSASVEASDIVLVDDNPEKVVTAVKLSKFTRKIVWQNIVLSAGIKILFLTLGTIGITGMLSAVIADVGVTVLAILNSLRALKYKIKN